MNENEFSNETIIPVRIFNTYLRWDAERQQYVIDQRVDPGQSRDLPIPLGARNHTFLGTNQPIGKWVLHMAGLEADVVRHMKERSDEQLNRLRAIEIISEGFIEALRGANLSDSEICEIFENINADLPHLWELTPPQREFTVKVTAKIEIEFEKEVTVLASSEDDARHKVESDMDEYIDLDDALKDEIASCEYGQYDFDIDIEVR
jgi:hypothetical protein